MAGSGALNTALGNCAIGSPHKEQKTTLALKKYKSQTSLVGRWLRFRTTPAGGAGFIPGQGSSTCCVMLPREKEKRNIHLIKEAILTNGALQNTQDHAN